MELPVPLVLSRIASIFRESALSNTVILQVADLPFATAVITAVPTPFALTVPFSFTAAIVVSLLLHTTFLFAPFIVALS